MTYYGKRTYADDDLPEWARDNDEYPTPSQTSKVRSAPVSNTTLKKSNEFNKWTFVSNILLNEWCTANTAIVYSYMLSRYTWFKSKGQDYFESQEAIMNAVHLSESTIKRSIKTLKEHGYLDVKSIRCQQFKKNVYVVLDKHGTYDNLKNSTTDLFGNKTKRYVRFDNDDEEGAPF